MIIALVRHGETDWNRQHRWQGRSDVPLNDLGKRQAAAAAPLLADRRWGWMITSPLERARNTGMIIAEQLPPMPFDVDEYIVEQDYGDADGMINSEAARRWPDGNFPGMESRVQLRTRGARAIEAIADGQSGDGVVVAHGGLIRASIDELCGIEAPRILNGAVSLIERATDGWRPVGLNLLGGIAALDAGGGDPGVIADPIPVGEPR